MFICFLLSYVQHPLQFTLVALPSLFRLSTLEPSTSKDLFTWKVAAEGTSLFKLSAS
jgi:hypothetical protein